MLKLSFYKMQKDIKSHPLIDVFSCFRDERTISQAIELNDQLQKALTRHDSLVSGRSMPTLAHIDHEEAEEEEDPEQLFRRYG